MHGLRSSTTTRSVSTLSTSTGSLGIRSLHDRGMQQLCTDDTELAGLLDAELDAQVGSLALVAHASLAQPSVLAAAGSVLSNVTAEGYPGRRYHPGAEQFDRIERMAVERAKAAFGASYANV